MCGGCGADRGAADWARPFLAGLAARSAMANAVTSAVGRALGSGGSCGSGGGRSGVAAGVGGGPRVQARAGGWLVRSPTGAVTDCAGLGELVTAVGRWLGTPSDFAAGSPPSGRLLLPSPDARRGIRLRVDPSAAVRGLAEECETVVVPDDERALGVLAELSRPPWSARRYLAESGHRGPLSVAVVTELRPLYADALVQAWRDVLGLEIRLIEVPASGLTTFTELGHLVLYPWSAHYPDAEYFLRVLFHSSSPSNLFGWSHPAFDDLIDRALAERTGAGRLGLFHQADRLVVQDECEVIPLVYGRSVTLLKPWVHGWSGWGSLSMPFDGLSIDEKSPRHRTWEGDPGELSD